MYPVVFTLAVPRAKNEKNEKKRKEKKRKEKKRKILLSALGMAIEKWKTAANTSQTEAIPVSTENTSDSRLRGAAMNGKRKKKKKKKKMKL